MIFCKANHNTLYSTLNTPKTFLYEIAGLSLFSIIYMFQARYSMGNKSITQLQYNEEDLQQALCHIDISYKEEDDAKNNPSFQLSDPLGIKESVETEKGADSSQLRKRNTPNPGDLSPGVETLSSEVDGFQVVQKKAGKDSKEIKVKNENEVVGKPSKDPIKWFGVLVPQALRQSQDRYKRALQHVPIVATLQTRLLKIKSEFRELHRKKNTILNEVQGADEDNFESTTLSDVSMSPTKEDESFFKNED